MKIKDKTLKQMVDVSGRDCPNLKCYWPRQNPGSFVQGRGYRSYGEFATYKQCEVCAERTDGSLNREQSTARCRGRNRR